MIELPKATNLLIAPPQMPDSRFQKAVMMLTHDHEGGSFALCVNRPTHNTLTDIAREIDIDLNLNFPMYWGGPVNSGVIWMLHSSEWSVDRTIELNDEWSMTSDVKMFYHLSDGDVPKYFRITFGMCTWAPGQLESEMRGVPPWNKNASWLTAENPGPEWLIEMSPETLWEASTALCSQQAVNSWF
jgi:putative transcriptional regulator